MPNLIISCDEKWPVFELEVPGEGQEANCDIPEDIYRYYLYISDIHTRMQKILRIYHDVSQRNISEHQCGLSFPEGSEVEQHSFNKVVTPTERELWPVLFENLTRLHRASQAEQ